jgi:molybdenum cofactor cytidylyltransferase
LGGHTQRAELAGAPLLQHAVDAMLAVSAIDPVRVVIGDHADRVRAAVDFGGASPLVCEDWTEGMAASLRAGVTSLRDCDWVVVTLGDQPRITPQVIGAILDATLAATGGTGAVRATYGGAPGHPVALGQPALALVPDLRGDVGARAVLDRVAVREVEVGHLCDPTDVDTPEELEGLRT